MTSILTHDLYFDLIQIKISIRAHDLYFDLIQIKISIRARWQ